MNQSLPGRLIALARWSGRFDPRPLRDVFPHGEALLRAPVAQLQRLGLPPSLVGAMQSTPPEESPFPWVTVLCPSYPPALLHLDRPPPVLWWSGDWALLGRTMVSVVGSRACTPYGRGTASRLGRSLGTAGLVLVSGAARGIDEAAHRGALQVKGGTVAVLGAGLERSSTSEGERLRRDIVEGQGLLISEMPPQDPATVWTFPRRNRIIAALGKATVVVEAAQRSGALITAREANTLGRDVYAVPGRWDAPASAGALAMIADGAYCLLDPDALVRALAPPPEGPGARLLSALQRPRSVDELCGLVGLNLREMLVLLAQLELQGRVTRGPDARYSTKF